MKQNIKKIFIIFLVVAMVLSFNVVTSASDTITVHIRVFDLTNYKTYEIGTDTVQKGTQGIQSEPYMIKELSEFTTATVGRVDKVVGNWYFPVSDGQVGRTVYFSNNSSIATITYWVNGYEPSETTPPGSDTEPTPDPDPGEEEGDVIVYFVVAYVDYEGTTLTYSESSLTLKMDCTSETSKYHNHTQNCFIKVKDFYPTVLQEKGLEIEDGYEWIGWCKDQASITPTYDIFYDFSSSTTNIQPRQTIYLIYQAEEPSDDGSIIIEDTTVDGDDVFTYVDAMMIMDYLSGNIEFTDAQLRAADVVPDGRVDYLDALAIMDSLAGIITI